MRVPQTRQMRAIYQESVPLEEIPPEKKRVHQLKHLTIATRKRYKLGKRKTERIRSEPTFFSITQTPIVILSPASPILPFFVPNLSLSANDYSYFTI